VVLHSDDDRSVEGGVGLAMTPDVMSPVGGSFCRRLRVARVGPAKALSPSRPDGRLLQQSYV